MIVRKALIISFGFFASTAANNRVNGSQFTEDALGVAEAAAPLFNFGRPHGYKSCYASGVYNHDGTQVEPSSQDNGIWWNLHKGCADQGEWQGVNTPGAANMPTYYTTSYCAKDNTWRVAYNLYWRHESEHEHDWEAAVVIWKQDMSNNNGSDDKWFRSGALLSFHRDYHYYSWADMQTLSTDNLEEFGTGSNKNHPRVFIGAFKHAMFREKYTRFDTLATAQWDEFRSNDWYYLAGSGHGDLIDGDTIPETFSFGKCTGPRYRARNICGYPSE